MAAGVNFWLFIKLLRRCSITDLSEVAHLKISSLTRSISLTIRALLDA